MSAVPPFDPAIGLIDPNFSANIPSYMHQFQHRMAVSFRHPYLAQPLLQHVANVPSQQQAQPPVHHSNANDSSRPDSAASSLTSNVPQTPTAMLSPTGIVTSISALISPYPSAESIVVAAAGLPPMAVSQSAALLTQFPGAIFTPTAYTNVNENSLKECVRKQM